MQSLPLSFCLILLLFANTVKIVVKQSFWRQKMDIEKKFTDFTEIIAKLRSPEGCPWDREQTHESLKTNLIEETYEVLDAIDRKDNADLCGELGDVLLQVVFHAQLAKEEGAFDINDVIDSTSNKMINRHPHVFGDEVAGTADEVLSNWERIKQQEGAKPKPVMQMNDNLPALMLARKLMDKAGRVGIAIPQCEKMTAEELGAALFELVLVGKANGIDAEDALRAYTKKMIKRFVTKEYELKEKELQFADMSEEEMSALWQKEV